MPSARSVAAWLGCVILAGCGAGADSGGSAATGGKGATGGSATGGASPGRGGADATGGIHGATGGGPAGGAGDATGGGPGGAAGSGHAGSTGGARGGAAGAGAGGAAQGGAGGTTGGGGAFQPAAHPKLPQVLSLGGAVLAAPKVLPIFYASDTGSADIKAFLKEYAASSAWVQQTSEYGVGPLTVLPAVTLSGTAPATVSEATLQSLLKSHTSGTNPSWGALDSKTIYLFIMPQGTIETTSAGSCCGEFDGYHVEAQIGSTAVPFAVGCTCPADAASRFTSLQERTVAISHELLESATDPYPNLDPAYAQTDDDDIIWTLVTGGELGDMCEFNDDTGILPSGAKYAIQRTWSNKAAARGDNPCVPVATTAPYLNAFPALSSVSFKSMSQTVSTLGVKIPIGQKKTVPVALSSAGPTSRTWNVQVFDYDQAVVGTTAALTLSLDKMSGKNGDTLQLAITPKAADPQLGGEAILDRVDSR